MDDLGGGIRNAIHRRPSEADTVSKIFGSMGGFKPRRLWEAGRNDERLHNFAYLPLWNGM
jgi:hypothetical protein